MKKPSTAVYLRFNKDKSQAFVNIRYTYHRQSIPFPLGFKINLTDWDSKRERVNFDVAGSSDFNSKIQDAITDINRISNQLIEDGKSPTINLVKEAYSLHLAYIEHHKTRKVKNKPVWEKLATDKETEIQLLEAKLAELKEQKGRFLRKIDNSVIEKDAYTESKKEFIKFLNEYILEKTGVRLNASKEELKEVPKATTGTNKGLRSWAKILVEFTNSKQVKNTGFEISFNNLGQNFYDTYASFLQTPTPKGKGYFNNTFGFHIKKLKGFLKWVELDKQLPLDRRYSRFKKLTEEKEIVILSKEEIDLLYQFEPEEKAGNSWRKYIDFTVFSWLTSLRISDIKRVKGFRIENDCLIGKTKKTGSNFKVSLNLDPRITEILKRYDYNMLLFSDVEYNRTVKNLLKMFCDKYGLHQKLITITRFKYIDPKPIESQHYFWKLYTSHCNRKGFVSHLSNEGYDNETIMEIMGTKSLSEFLKYQKHKTSHITDTVNRVQIINTVLGQKETHYSNLSKIIA